MRGRSLLLALLSAFALGGLTLLVTPGTAHAAPIRMDGGNERTMIQDETSLYIIDGNVVFKLDKISFKIVKKTILQ